VSGSGICWATCKSAPHPRQPRQHSTTQFFTGRMPSCRPTNRVKALNDKIPRVTQKYTQNANLRTTNTHYLPLFQDNVNKPF